ncbi:uncharacterized protein LOC106090967 [Stomoxys calcitrans]|uniref:uncharacterized protein LOC106090967 n=1 Tax=Stomoxys calcitrans TaxID=35570 RepID=UPI0027E367D8|nr:uncharacterized protein LOC106090967 [Stomoxys calcitrans]
MAIDTISNVAIFIASVFLIIGIKRRHHTFVAPWVFVVAICVVLNLLKLIPNQETLLQSLVSVAIQVIIWYPIFSLYQELRKTTVNPGDDYDACPTKEPSADGEAYPQKTDDNTPTETDNPTEMGH